MIGPISRVDRQRALRFNGTAYCRLHADELGVYFGATLKAKREAERKRCGDCKRTRKRLRAIQRMLQRERN